MFVPEYLEDLDALKTYMRRRADGLTEKQKGDIFANLVRHVFALSTEFRDFNQPELNPKAGSHDLGTDLKASHVSLAGVTMHIQARWSIDRVDAIDGVLGKFKTFSESPTGEANIQSSLLPVVDEKNHYMIATLDRLDSLLKAYEKQTNRPTRLFFDELKQNNRFHVLDGQKILEVLQSEWARYYKTEMSTNITSVTGEWLHWQNVRIGIVAGDEIVRIYKKFGRSIFFDNIRDYLGHSASENDEVDFVNNGIMNTVAKYPDKMLSRNNGIVIRAAKVNQVTGGLELENMSIVNGCQTTMSIVNSPRNTDSCCILVKVVETNDHWDITRTANLQNEVSRIELDLAQWLRPQIVELAALEQQRPYESDDVFAFMSSLNQRRVQYENIRAMFIGLFSAAPYNIIKRDRNMIQLDLVQKVYEKDPKGSHLFKMLFDLYAAAQVGKDRVNKIYAGTENIDAFSRFLDENKGFISFIAILAACSATGIDISKVTRSKFDLLVSTMQRFIDTADDILAKDPEKMIEYFIAAYQATINIIASKHSEADVSKIRQHMSLTIERANFSNLINQTEAMYRFRNAK